MSIHPQRYIISYYLLRNGKFNPVNSRMHLGLQTRTRIQKFDCKQALHQTILNHEIHVNFHQDVKDSRIWIIGFSEIFISPKYVHLQKWKLNPKPGSRDPDLPQQGAYPPPGWCPVKSDQLVGFQRPSQQFEPWNTWSSESPNAPPPLERVQGESNAYNRLYPPPSKIAYLNLSPPHPQARHNHEIEPLFHVF